MWWGALGFGLAWSRVKGGCWGVSFRIASWTEAEAGASGTSLALLGAAGEYSLIMLALAWTLLGSFLSEQRRPRPRLGSLSSHSQLAMCFVFDEPSWMMPVFLDRPVDYYSDSDSWAAAVGGRRRCCYYYSSAHVADADS